MRQVSHKLVRLFLGIFVAFVGQSAVEMQDRKCGGRERWRMTCNKGFRLASAHVAHCGSWSTSCSEDAPLGSTAMRVCYVLLQMHAEVPPGMHLWLRSQMCAFQRSSTVCLSMPVCFCECLTSHHARCVLRERIPQLLDQGMKGNYDASMCLHVCGCVRAVSPWSRGSGVNVR